MRTLVATVLYNAKGKRIYCTAQKINPRDLKTIRNAPREELMDLGFTFIDLASPDYANVRGYAIFFEGHLDEMQRCLKNLESPEE